MANALHNLGHVARVQGDHVRAMALFEESVPLYRDSGNPHGIAWTRFHLGQAAYARGDTGRAVALLKDSAAMHREVGDMAAAATALDALATTLREWDACTQVREESRTPEQVIAEGLPATERLNE